MPMPKPTLPVKSDHTPQGTNIVPVPSTGRMSTIAVISEIAKIYPPVYTPISLRNDKPITISENVTRIIMQYALPILPSVEKSIFFVLTIFAEFFSPASLRIRLLSDA